MESKNNSVESTPEDAAPDPVRVEQLLANLTSGRRIYAICEEPNDYLILAPSYE